MTHLEVRRELVETARRIKAEHGVCSLWDSAVQDICQIDVWRRKEAFEANEESMIIEGRLMTVDEKIARAESIARDLEQGKTEEWVCYHYRVSKDACRKIRKIYAARS